MSFAVRPRAGAASLSKLTLDRTLPFILLVGGAIGTLCAAILTIEKIQLLRDPQSSLACDINPIIACGSVINTPQASAFGFPNPILGLIGFSLVLAVGAGLLAGARYKRWFWLSLQAGTLFGVLFVTWLQYQSIFNIGALCPFCMVVWAVTIPIFWYTTLYNLGQRNMVLPARFTPIAGFMRRHHGDVLIVWYLIIVGVILQHFWYYWRTLI